MYTAGVIRVCFFWQSTGPIIGIREPTPLYEITDTKQEYQRDVPVSLT